MIENKTGLERPEKLCKKGKKAYKIIVDFLKEKNMTYTGGQKTFYSPVEWIDRGEKYCRGAYLVMVYDGGDLSHILNLDNPLGWPLEEELTSRLNEAGFYYECGTHWFAGVYDA